MVVWVTQMWLSMPTMMHDSGPVTLRLSSAFFTSGVLRNVSDDLIQLGECLGVYIMENSVLSRWHFVLTPSGASSPSSGQVSPRRALF